MDDRPREFEEAVFHLGLGQAVLHPPGQRLELAHGVGIAAAMAADHDAGLTAHLPLSP